jgi:putative membrane protein
MMMYWGNSMGTGSWIFSILGTLIILALVVAAVAWLLSARRAPGGSSSTPGESAHEILNRRLASGELTAEQYQQLRDTLSDAPSSSFTRKPRRPAGTRA